MQVNKRTIIIDTDPGLDDAIAAPPSGTPDQPRSDASRLAIADFPVRGRKPT